MSLDRIERQIFIDAPVGRVWELVSVPAFWVAEASAVEGMTAAAGLELVADNPHVGKVAVRVLAVDEPTAISYLWASAFPGQDLRDDNSTTVEFSLLPKGDGTVLRVVESGFDALALSPDSKTRAYGFNDDGWTWILNDVSARAVA